MPRFVKNHRPTLRGLIALWATSLLVLPGCGGGGGSSGGNANVPPLSACAATVTTGFTGDLNATYSDGFGGTGGDGGASAGGGAGSGGGEGKVLGGLMTVTRISDGVDLGSAVTDSVNGLVTIKPCALDGPVLLTLSGRAGAQYYDEGAHQLTPFATGVVLHALVDTFDENVGVSALTEAAYRYALNNYVGSPAAIKAGTAPLLAAGSVKGLTLAQVQSANGKILNEINRVLTTATQLSSIKPLPTPIDNASSASALPVNLYGLSAVVTGGLARLAHNYLPSSSTPALAATEQLARDLTDGKLDGIALDGSAAAPGSAILYDAADIPVAIDGANYSVSAEFGATTTFTLGSGFSDFTIAYMPQNGNLETSVCSSQIDSSVLLKNGTVNVYRLGNPSTPGVCAGEPGVLLSTFASNVRFLAGNARDTFLVLNDGTLQGWGDSNCGILGDGLTSGRTITPKMVAGVSNITSLHAGFGFVVARDANGDVFSWGSDMYGALGQGPSPTYDVSQCEPQSGTLAAFGIPDGAITTPRKIPGIGNISSVAAGFATALAIDGSGHVYQWGLVASNTPTFPGSGTPSPTPTLVPGVSSAVQVTVSQDISFVLKADGTVWGFGQNGSGLFGDGTRTPKLIPTQVPGLSNVSQIASAILGNGAVLNDGSVMVWDGGLNLTPTLLSTVTICPVVDSISGVCLSPAVTGPLPKIRQIFANGNSVNMLGYDGNIYVWYWTFPGESPANATFVRFLSPSSFGVFP